MLSIPTSLKQISHFRKELTYITDSVKKNEKLEGLRRKKKKVIVEVPDGFFDFMVWFLFTFNCVGKSVTYM